MSAIDRFLYWPRYVWAEFQRERAFDRSIDILGVAYCMKHHDEIMKEIEKNFPLPSEV